VTGPFLLADWPAPPCVRAFTTLRHGLGVSAPPFDHFNLGGRYAQDGDDSTAIKRNRELLVEHASLPSRPHWLRQVHGAGVIGCGAESESRFHLAEGVEEPEADACVASDAGVVLAILTADCLPVLFCSEAGDEVAAAHAGWRGLADGVLEATVSAMQTPGSQLLAWLGPAAGPEAYEIGDEVRDAFLAHDADAATNFVATRENHWRVDLYALARMRLAAIGVHRVYGGGLCTISDPQRFYSHRRDQRTGRMASLVWID